MPMDLEFLSNVTTGVMSRVLEGDGRYAGV